MAKTTRQTKEKLEQSLSKNSTLAIIMIVVTLVVAGSIIASKVLIADIRYNNKVLGEKRHVNAILEDNVSNLEPLRENFTRLEEDGPRPNIVLTALPVHHNYHELASQLESMASSNDVELLTVAPSGESVNVVESTDTAPEAAPAAANETAADAQTNVVAQQPSPQPITFTLSVNGRYDDLRNFIGSLEQFIRPIQVNQVTFNGSDPSVVLEATITTYFQERTGVSNETRVIQ